MYAVTINGQRVCQCREMNLWRSRDKVYEESEHPKFARNGKDREQDFRYNDEKELKRLVQGDSDMKPDLSGNVEKFGLHDKNRY